MSLKLLNQEMSCKNFQNFIASFFVPTNITPPPPIILLVSKRIRIISLFKPRQLCRFDLAMPTSKPCRGREVNRGKGEGIDGRVMHVPCTRNGGRRMGRGENVIPWLIRESVKGFPLLFPPLYPLCENTGCREATINHSAPPSTDAPLS